MQLVRKKHIKEFSLFKGVANSKKLKVITVGSKNNSDWNFKINNSDKNIKNIELLYKDKKSLLKTDIVGDFQISNLVIRFRKHSIVFRFNNSN